MSACVLDSSVLVLNRLFMAVHVVPVRRAMSLLVKDSAEVVFVENDKYATYDFESWTELSMIRAQFPPDEETEYVRTVSLQIRVPRIIRLLVYDRLPAQEVKFNRRNIYARDENRCQYCGRRFATSELSLDHVIPRSLGGRATWDNLVCACIACNARKGGRTPQHASMTLVRKPSRPKRNPLLSLSLGSAAYRSWRQFLSDAYWSVELK